MNEDVPHLPQVRQSDLERVSEILSINCYVVIFLSIISSGVIAIALILSVHFSDAKRAFVALVGVAVVLGLMVLVIARRKPAVMSIFTMLQAYMAGILLGVGVALLTPVLLQGP